MKRTRIRLRWTDWRYRVMLCGLYLFYRLCNRAGLGRDNDPLDLTQSFTEPVGAFLDGDHKIHVYNYAVYDGRVVTVMIAQVCGEGPYDLTPPHV